MRRIKELNPKTVLDVGTGMGDYLELIKTYLSSDIAVDGVEVWEPYVKEYALEKRYDKLFIQDVREMVEFSYDLVILGDVLEHMPEDDAVKLWEAISKQAKHALISIPIGHHPQGAWGGNPYEVHHEEDWSTERVLEAFPGIIEHKEFDITGVFIAKFK
jgi:cyclopropane fatty-acyl-phospholipid synthase-like methyltransferase